MYQCITADGADLDQTALLSFWSFLHLPASLYHCIKYINVSVFHLPASRLFSWSPPDSSHQSGQSTSNYVIVIVIVIVTAIVIVIIIIITAFCVNIHKRFHNFSTRLLSPIRFGSFLLGKWPWLGNDDQSLGDANVIERSELQRVKSFTHLKISEKNTFAPKLIFLFSWIDPSQIYLTWPWHFATLRRGLISN